MRNKKIFIVVSYIMVLVLTICLVDISVFATENKGTDDAVEVQAGDSSAGDAGFIYSDDSSAGDASFIYSDDSSAGDADLNDSDDYGDDVPDFIVGEDTLETESVYTGYEGADIQSVVFGEDAVSKITDKEIPSSFHTEDRPLGLRNQNPYGTCWAFSTLGACETSLIRQGYASKALDLSEAQLAFASDCFGADYPFGGLEGSYVTNNSGVAIAGGGISLAARVYSIWIGPVAEEKVPYSMCDTLSDCNEDDKTFVDAVAFDTSAHITAYHSINPEDRRVLKAYMLENYGASIGYLSKGSEYYNKEHNAYYYPYDEKGGGHAVTIIGWNDHFPKEYFNHTPLADGAWLVRNSWTTDAQEKESNSGYFWLSYYDAGIDSYEVFKMEPSYAHDFNYQYDLNFYIDDQNVYEAANIFRAHGDEEGETLDQVGFWLPENTKFTVYVYQNDVCMYDPQDGQLVCTTDGESLSEGYYTIPLSKEVLLNKGDYFSIIISYERNGNNQLVYTEKENTVKWVKGAVVSTHVNIDRNQSFYKENATGEWKDLYTDVTEKKLSTGNYVIKAFTVAGKNDGKVKAKSIDVTNVANDEVWLNPGNTFQAYAQILPVKTADKTTIWTSTDENVATVDNNGLITAKGCGSTVITVKTGENSAITDSVTVYVNDIQSVSINLATTYAKGDCVKLTFDVAGDYNSTNAKIKWYTTTPDLCSIDNEGMLTCKTIGEAGIYVWIDGAVSDVYTTKITCEKVKHSFARAVGGNRVLLTWEAIEDADSYWIVRKVDDESYTIYAKMESSGADSYVFYDDQFVGSTEKRNVRYGIKAVNNKVALYGNETRFTIDPENNDKEVTVSGKTLLSVGAKEQYTCTVNGVLAEKVTWISTNPDVAAFSDDGVLSVISHGTTTIYAMVNNQYSEPMAVTTYSFKLEGQCALDIGEEYHFVCKTNSTETVKWESSDCSVATVDSNGTVKAQKIGVTYISAMVGTEKSVPYMVTVTPVGISDFKINAVADNVVRIEFTASGDVEDYEILKYDQNNIKTLVGSVNGKKAGSLHLYDRNFVGKETPETCSYSIRAIVHSGDTTYSLEGRKKTFDFTPGRKIAIAGNHHLRQGEVTKLSYTTNMTSVKSVAWRSSNPFVATVDQDGRINAFNPGHTRIELLLDEVQSQPFELIVQKAQPYISGSISVMNGTNSKYVLKDGLGNDITDQNITFSSSNTDVATIDNSGLLTAKDIGYTIITAICTSGVYELKVKVTPAVYHDAGWKIEYVNKNKIFYYTGEAVKPAIIVTYNGKELTEGVDYTVRYSNNINASVERKNKPKITVSGKGNLTSTTVSYFEIQKRDFADVVIGNTTVVQGTKVTPVFTYRGKKLTAKDYDCPELSKPFYEQKEITVRGKGNFTGEKQVTIHIMTKDQLSRFVVNYSKDILTYNGTEQIIGFEVLDAKTKVKLSKDDYILTVTNNVNAGTAQITIVGRGNYIGMVTKKFQIKPASTAKVSVRTKDSYPYQNKPVTIDEDLLVTGINGIKLVKGIDYKISYTSNTKVGIGKYTITFLGNYKATPAYKGTFTISAGSLEQDEEGIKIVVGDQVYTGKPGTYTSVPYVTLNGVEIKKSDYTCSYYYYNADKKVMISRLTPIALAGDENIKTVYVEIKGKGNFETKVNGPVSSYRVVRKGNAQAIEMKNVRVTLLDDKGYKTSRFEYQAGVEIEPKILVEYKDGRVYKTLDPKLYSVSYSNNVNKGRATIVLNGNGTDTVGNKTVTFTIVARNLKTLMDLWKGNRQDATDSLMFGDEKERISDNETQEN